ncbi:MAG TPA: HEAT repeat domain-containing protein [Holophaga sp.]|nr:HEAT repeat domain-containing protein [Holophaga sp.]
MDLARDLASALARNDPVELAALAVSLGQHAEERAWAEGACIQLARHADERVRAAAIRAFRHLAGRFGQLDAASVRPVLAKALQDPSMAVRREASAALDELGLCPRC